MAESSGDTSDNKEVDEVTELNLNAFDKIKLALYSKEEQEAYKIELLEKQRKKKEQNEKGGSKGRGVVQWLKDSFSPSSASSSGDQQGAGSSTDPPPPPPSEDNNTSSHPPETTSSQELTK